MTRNGTREVSLSTTTMDLTPRNWSEEEIRNAQLHIASIALDSAPDAAEEFLYEALDMLGLLPSSKIRKARYRTNMTSVDLRKVPQIAEADDTTTDMQRNTSRVVDTKGHGTLAGYWMHVKRYERPCEDCQIMYELERDEDLKLRGFTPSPNHMIGYQ